MNPSRLSLSSSTLILAGSILAACGPAPRESAAPPAPAPFRARAIPVVQETAVTARTVSGTVVSEKRATLASRVSGTVTAIHARRGDEVRRGERLLSIDPETATGTVLQARGALAQAEAAFELAQRNHERFLELHRRQSATPLELETARMELERARGAVEQARGALQAAQSIARESEIVAPFDGRILSRWVDVGDLVGPGRPLLEIESRRGRKLEVALPESWGAEMVLRRRDQRIPVSLDAYPELGEIPGRIAEASPGPDPASRSYIVQLELDLPDPEAVPAGTSGRAFFPHAAEPRIWLPASAILARGGLELVVVRSREGFALTRPVSTGTRRLDGYVEILSGLDAGEVVGLEIQELPPAGARFEVVP